MSNNNTNKASREEFDALIKLMENNDIQKVDEFLSSKKAESLLDHKHEPHCFTPPYQACFKHASLEMAEVFIKHCKRIGGQQFLLRQFDASKESNPQGIQQQHNFESPLQCAIQNNNNKNNDNNTTSSAALEIVTLLIETFKQFEHEKEDYLRSALIFEDASGFNPLLTALVKCANIEVFKLTLNTYIGFGADFFKQVLFAKNASRQTIIAIACVHCSNVQIFQTMLDAVKAVLGPDVLKKLLVEKNCWGQLPFAAAFAESTSPEVIKLIVKTYSSFGDEFIKNAVVDVDNHEDTALSLTVQKSTSETILQILIATIKHVGGNSLLKEQLQQTNKIGCNVMLSTCCNQYPNKIFRLLFRIIEERFGQEFLNEMLSSVTVPTGRYVSISHMTLLTSLCASYTLTAECMKTVFEAMEKCGGRDFLIFCLSQEDGSGRNGFTALCEYERENAGEVFDFMCRTLVDLDLFDQMYEYLEDESKEKLKQHEIDEHFGENYKKEKTLSDSNNDEGDV